MRTLFAYYCGKCISLVSTLVGFGTGITWAGEVALRIDPQFIAHTVKAVDKRIVVAGTNGKTTTASLIAHIFSKENFSIVHNATGANLPNGIAGTLIQNYSCLHHGSVCIFETDEAVFSQICQEVKPTVIVLLNLFRDQLDRYGEVDVIAEKWKETLDTLPKTVTLVANGDDPLIVDIAVKVKGAVLYFGLNNQDIGRKALDHATDSIYCLSCNAKLAYNTIYLSHQGDWYCPSCGRKRPSLVLDTVASSLPGVYNLYNTLAATVVANHFKLTKRIIEEHVNSFVPAFGRQEAFEKDGKTIKIFLSKNPTGFNESLRTVLSQADLGGFIFALNDRIPDGTDVSWIWDVDFEMLNGTGMPIICTGDRAWDMGLRLKYQKSNIKNQKEGRPFFVRESLKDAIQTALETTPREKTLYILATYSAMLDIRKILTGRKI